MFSAPRLWWLLRLFGHDAVSVLDGGMQKWRAEDRPTENDADKAAPMAGNAVATLAPASPQPEPYIVPTFRRNLLRSYAEMLRVVEVRTSHLRPALINKGAVEVKDSMKKLLSSVFCSPLTQRVSSFFPLHCRRALNVF